jgi:HPt (histidine-containing phosphotransfer) domain-containing protein
MADQHNLPLLNGPRDLLDDECSRLLDVYLLESERQFHEANEAWEVGDLARLGRSAQGLGGASRGIGAFQLAGYCSELELAARRNREEHVRLMLQQVTAELREVRDAVHAVRQSCGAA